MTPIRLLAHDSWDPGSCTPGVEAKPEHQDHDHIGQFDRLRQLLANLQKADATKNKLKLQIEVLEVISHRGD